MLESFKDRFVRDSIGDYSCAVRLAGDASHRIYYRIYTEDISYILCEDGRFRNVPEEDYPYLIVYKLLRRETVPVPEVYYKDSKEGLLLIQDAGDDLLENIYNNLSLEDKRQIYRDLIDVLIKIQRIRRDDNLPPFHLSFDVEKLMNEFNFFLENAVEKFFPPAVSEKDLNELKIEFHKISELLFRPDYFVLNHRDYHSRNIILKGEIPFVIDFQDARMGLPQYDMVSLLRDSYVRLDDPSLNILKEYYYNCSRDNGIQKMSRHEFEYYFDLMAFQRNIKAIGTFCFQSALPGRERYKDYIRPTMAYLEDYIGRRSELRRAGEMVKAYMEEIE